MTATNDEKRAPVVIQIDALKIGEALDRGELLRLLAEVEAGRIKPEQLEAVLNARDKKRWVRSLFHSILGNTTR